MSAERFHAGRNMAGPILEYDPVAADFGCKPSWCQAFDVLWDRMGGYASVLVMESPVVQDNYLAIVRDERCRDIAYWLVRTECRCGVPDAR